MTLDELGPDNRATVVALEIRGTQRRRLMDLGLLPGTEVRVDMTSPLGDPTAYLVRDGLIALRRSQARAVHVEVRDGSERQ
ncbi:MAG: ferrous iron transport protein A [Pseudonocardiaceae bacterium]|nr:ferrous iron transport protein A [Pseudonocardiaceae bacterium]